jgi:hypothetical protein
MSAVVNHAREVSVVIPTRDRDDLLAVALEGLAAQSISAERFEVIVVRDAEQAGPVPTMPPGLNGRVIAFHGNPRAADAKRNLGWQESEGRLIAFTDDDCRPAPSWLESLLAAWDDQAVLQGRTEPDPRQLQALRGFARTQEIVGGSPWFETCNMAYARSLLEAVGGFDEAFILDGEDTDLALRALAAGGRYRYVEEALVWHAVHSHTLMHALRFAAGSTSLPLVFRRHPAHRRHLLAGVFRNEAHASLTFAILVALICRNRLAVALGLAPYLSRMVSHEVATTKPSPRAMARFLVFLPGRFAVDLARLLGTARGAIRHKTLML